MFQKLFKYSLITFAFVVLFPLSTNAQSTGVSQTSLFVKEITLNQSTYKAGDTVNGTFTLYSQGDNAVPDAYYSISLVGDYQANTLAGTVYDTKQFGPLYIGANDSKSISFSYVLPQGVSGTDLGIQIQAKLKSGMPMGWSDAKNLTITGGVPYMTINDAYLTVNKNEFDV